MTNENSDGSIQLDRIAIILLFATTFTLIGWLSPVLYATYIPSDQIIEVHDFEAQDTTTNSEQHYLYLDRTITKDRPGKVFTELYLINSNGRQQIEVDTEATDRYFQSGRTEVAIPYTLPENLQEGEYRYLLVIKMELADGRVTRTMDFESSKFEITDK